MTLAEASRRGGSFLVVDLEHIREAAGGSARPPSAIAASQIVLRRFIIVWFV